MMNNWKKVIIEGIIKIGLIFLLLLAYRSYGQMYRWQMDTFKNAEKSKDIVNNLFQINLDM